MKTSPSFEPTNRPRLLPLVLFLCIGGIVALALWLTRPSRPRAAPAASEAGLSEEDEAWAGNNTDVAVHAGAIARATLRRSVTAYGTVAASPARDGRPAAGARVTAPAASLVTDVAVGEGQRVASGQALFTLDPRGADAAVERARQAVAADQDYLDRLTAAGTAVPPWHAAQAKRQLETAKADLAAAQARRQTLDVTSPLAGTVVRLNIRPGEVADPAATAVEVIDLGRLVVEAHVPAAALRDVKVGQAVTIDAPAAAAAAASGAASHPATASAAPPATAPAAAGATVAFVDDAIDPATGMGSLDVALPPGAPYRPGQFVVAEVVCEERADVLTAPVESVVRDEWGEPEIALVSPDGRRATMKNVQLGLREGDVVEIRGDGLQAGEPIVTTGAYGLLRRTNVRIVGR